MDVATDTKIAETFFSRTASDYFPLRLLSCLNNSVYVKNLHASALQKWACCDKAVWKRLVCTRRSRLRCDQSNTMVLPIVLRDAYTFTIL